MKFKEDGTILDWSAEGQRLAEIGDYESSLRYLNLCLGEESGSPSKISADKKDSLKGETNALSTSDAFDLLEKRCFVHIRLKNYDAAVVDAQKLIQLKKEHALAHKCLLIALCKSSQLAKIRDCLKVWELMAPKDLVMIESRTKIHGLIEAVSRGIEPQLAFSDIEDALSVNFEWLLKKKSDNRWKYRPLPSGVNSFVLCLQYRFGHCSLGQKCPDAHGEQELQEWKLRIKTEDEENKDAPKSNHSSIIQSLLDKISNAGDESLVLSEECDPKGIKIKCRESLKVQVNSKKLKPYSWTFAIESPIPLQSICLLHEFHRQYFKITSACIHEKGSKVSLLSGEEENTQSFEARASANAREDANLPYTYSIVVSFTPELLGKFRQSVVFDFGTEPKAVRNLSVEVYPEDDDENEAKSSGEKNAVNGTDAAENRQEDSGVLGRKRCIWNFGNAEIVHGTDGRRVSSEKLGFALISGASKLAQSKEKKEVLTRENYKAQMRYFLTEEERARQEIISKYNVSALLKVMNMYSLTSGYFEGESKFAVDGCLYGQMTLFRDISEDTSVGRLILRSCNSVLLTTTAKAQQTGEKPRVYLCDISDKTKNDVYINLGTTCVQELGLKANDSVPFDIQFQLDRTAFMEQKKVIDKLNETHLEMLFPDFSKDYKIPWSPMMQWNPSDKLINKLNPKQKESLIAVTCEDSFSPPILLVGPFGTGKTYTLAQCVRRILTHPNSRVMICTQSNSAADLYIKEYLDKWVEEGCEEARPLRVYYALRSFKTVHQNVFKYCIIEQGRFRNPTKEDIMSHRVVVVTLGTSFLLMDLDLPQDTFSHILLDEAAQAMETEAITPLLSAGPKTKLVLAGDHMQLNPELFCGYAKNFYSSLLERLHCTYPASHPCKLMLCENYRSHEAIIKFASASFYDNRLECGMSQPAHERIYPLSFYAARGEDLQEVDSTSYFNMAEVFEITEKVAEVISSWPESWGDVTNESAIGVLTPYADQVSKIRAHLRRRGMTHVSVERVLNVQGKQFRVVFLSTVRTYKPWVRILPEAVGKEVDLGFFSNPKLLNTALTRAQSLVAVVGDPVSLCSVGKCRVLWEDFIRTCHENNSLHGITYMQLKENILGAEMRLMWGLNPLANEFKPKLLPLSSGKSAPLVKPASPSVSSNPLLVSGAQSPSRGQMAQPQPQVAPISNNARIPPLMSAFVPTPPFPPVPQHVPWGPQPMVAPFIPHNAPAPYPGMPTLGPPGQYPIPRPRMPIFTGNYNPYPPPVPGMIPYGVQPPPPPPPMIGNNFAPPLMPPNGVPAAMMGNRQQMPSARPPGPPLAPPLPRMVNPLGSEPRYPGPMLNNEASGYPAPPYPPNGMPYASPQLPEVQQLLQRSTIAERVSGVPLYKRPFELQSSTPSSPTVQAEANLLASANAAGDGLSDDDMVCLKEILRRYAGDNADPAVESERLRRICSKLGVPVSESSWMTQDLCGPTSTSVLTSGPKALDKNHSLRQYSPSQLVTGPAGMSYPITSQTNDLNNIHQTSLHRNVETSSALPNGYTLNQPSRSPYLTNGRDGFSSVLNSSMNTPTLNNSLMTPYQPPSGGSGAFASGSLLYGSRVNESYLRSGNGSQAQFSNVSLGEASKAETKDEKPRGFGSPRSYANVVKQAVPIPQNKPPANPDALLAQQFLSLCAKNTQAMNSNGPKQFGRGAGGFDSFFK